MVEIDLMQKYPRTKRNLNERAEKKTAEDVALAREFGREFFDGDRRHGYGGFNYHERFWSGVVKDLIEYYKLSDNSKVLDVGCAKGFTLHDLKKSLPGINVYGIDISEYAINNAMDSIRSYVSVGNAYDLSRFQDNEFDLAISINTIHNLPIDQCKKAILEIQRVSKNTFIVNDAWRNDQEKENMLQWNLTGVTFMHVEDWKKLFQEIGYKRDYYWFTP